MRSVAHRTNLIYSKCVRKVNFIWCQRWWREGMQKDQSKQETSGNTRWHDISKQLTKENYYKQNYTSFIRRENIDVLTNRGKDTTVMPWCWNSFPMNLCLKGKLPKIKSGLIPSAFGYSHSSSLSHEGELSFIVQKIWGRDERINGEGWGWILLSWEATDVHLKWKG